MSNDLRAFVCDFQIDKLEFVGYLVLARRAYLPKRFLNSWLSMGTTVKRSPTMP
jgi:hypothetical protein